MDLVAIASLKTRGNTTGARIMDFDTFETMDLYIVDIIRLIENGIGIQNIGCKVNTENIEWTQGVEGRYTSIDMDIQNITNKYTIIIKDWITRNNIKLYRIVNYLGEVRLVSTNDLLNYGLYNTIANGKIVNNNIVMLGKGR